MQPSVIRNQRPFLSDGKWVLIIPLLAVFLAVGAPQVSIRATEEKAGEAPQRVVILPPLVAAYATIDEGLAHVVGASEFVKARFKRNRLSHIYKVTDKLKSAGGTSLTDPELILSLHPDAVVVWRTSTANAQELGLPQATLDTDMSMESRLRLWLALGVMTGKPERAQWLIDEFQTERNRLKSSFSFSAAPLRVVLFNGAAGGLGYFGGRSSYVSSILDFLPAKNAADSIGWGPVNLETMAMIDPDVILLDSTLSEQSPQQLYSIPAWTIVRAVREKKVYLMPRFNFWAPPMDQHLVLQWLAEVLYPDTEKALRETYIRTFARTYNVLLSEVDLNEMLFVEQNKFSTGYTRFMPLQQ